ncbi:MAG: hypothetical protein IPQ07_15835 [Myxococcales bacterium]|nr:hypothetical protein [Myxococcales bacterium]
MKLAAALFALLVIGSVGCKDDPPEAYPTYQECFDDHTTHEMLPVMEAIVICCLEHPIAGVAPVCGDTKPDCINYLTNNLNQTSASTIEVMDACADYVTQKSM